MSDLRTLPDLHRVPLRFPSNFGEIVFSKKVIPPQRFLTAVDRLTSGQATQRLARALFREMFHTADELVPLDRPERLTELALRAGVDRAVIDEALLQKDAEQTRATIRANVEELVGLGGFGVPTFQVERPDREKVIVFGSDRIELLAHLLGEKYDGVNPK